MSKDIIYFNKAEPFVSTTDAHRYAVPFTMTDETDHILYAGTYDERTDVANRIRAVLEPRGYTLDGIDYSRRLIIIEKQ